MAKTRDYMDYLDNQIGIAPANSQEEFQAAETIVEVMKDHGLEPTIQEFDTHPLGELMPNVLYLTLFLGVLLSGLSGGVVRGVGLILALASAVLLGLNHGGNNVFANLGPVQRSQNVIGVHRASGDKVVKGSRPIVIVAHYDTPRENILFGSAFARYQSTLYKIVYPCVAVAAVMALTQVMGFLPVVVRVLLWVMGLVACVPTILIAVANIMERFAGCTAGSNDNKSSIAAMLSVLNKVSPAEDRVDAAAEGRPYVRRASEDQKPETMMVPERPVGVRHGKEVLESLGMLPPTCEVIYEEPKLVSVAVADMQQDGAAGSASAENALSIEQDYEPTVEEAVNPQADADSQAYVSEQSDDTSVAGYAGVEERDEDYSANSGAGQDAQEDDEYYVNNTEEPESQEPQYDGVSTQDSADEPVPEASEVDSTVQRTMSDQRRSGKPASSKKPVGKRISNWFKGIRKRLSRKDDEPVRITRGKNKDDDYADYSQYETTYDGEDELDQWSTGETEQLRPVRREEVRRRVNTADEPSDQTSAEPSNDQTLGEIYGQFSSDEETSAEDVPAVDGVQDAGEGQPERDWSDATDHAETSSSDFDVEEADEHAVVDLKDDDVCESDGPEPEPTQSEQASDVDQPDSDEGANDASASGWDVTPDSDRTLEASDESAQEASDQENPVDVKIPDPVRIDTIQPERRTVRKASNEGGSPQSQSGSEPEGATRSGASQDSGSDLSWDQPSVEDEEYYEEYPHDDDDTNSYEDNDEYYERYDGEPYEEGEPESQAWEDSQYENVYDEANASEGGFHKFVDRVKGLFSHNSHHDDEQRYEEPNEDYDDPSYDEIEEYPAEGEGSAHVAEDDGQNIQFEEVKSEEYLPSKEDALYGDMDDDYDFPETNSSVRTVSQADEKVSNKRATRLQFEQDAREHNDILPKDTTGLDTLLDDDYAESESTERAKPAPIDDPTWGKSTYEPPVSRTSIARRAALLDLPNPSVAPVDPLDEPDDYEDGRNGESDATSNEKSDLDDTAAQNNVSNDSRRDNWKGGAALRSDLRSDGGSAPEDAEGYLGDEYQESGTMPPDEAQEGNVTEGSLPDEGDMQEAILDMGDDLLLSHDVWFVAVGASSVGHAGIKSFLANFRKDIRGAFLLNLDSIGAGVPVVLTREGLDNGRRADRRSLRLFEDTAKDLHMDVQHIDYGWHDTDATPAMRSRVRSITVMGMDENGLPALSHTQNDVPMNIDPKQVSSIVRVVCEFIRRS